MTDQEILKPLVDRTAELAARPGEEARKEPRSSVAAAAGKYRGAVNLEVHAHPEKVFFGASREDMRAELAGLVAAAGGHPLSLNLSDIHLVNGNPETLRIWAEEAQRAAEK